MNGKVSLARMKSRQNPVQNSAAVLRHNFGLKQVKSGKHSHNDVISREENIQRYLIKKSSN